MRQHITSSGQVRVYVKCGHAADRTVSIRQVATRVTVLADISRRKCWQTSTRRHKYQSGASTRSQRDLAGHTLRASGCVTPRRGWGGTSQAQYSSPPCFLRLEDSTSDFSLVGPASSYRDDAPTLIPVQHGLDPLPIPLLIPLPILRPNVSCPLQTLHLRWALLTMSCPLILQRQQTPQATNGGRCHVPQGFSAPLG